MIYPSHRDTATFIAVLTFGFLSSCAVADRGSDSARRLSPLEVGVAVAASAPVAAAGSSVAREISHARHASTSPVDADQPSSGSVVRTPSMRATEELSQSNPPRRDGNLWEVTLNGGGTSNNDLDAGGGSIGASVGYYFTEVVEGSVRQLFTFSDPGNNQSTNNNGATRVALDLHIPFEHVVPYVGANFGWVYGDNVNESLVAGPEGGLKIYVKDDVFLQAAVEYLFFFDDSSNARDSFDDGAFIYSLGFGVRF